VELGWSWPSGACWAIAKGTASVKASAPAPAHSIHRAAPRLSEFHRSLDQIIIDLSFFRGVVQVYWITSAPASLADRVNTRNEA
jgi:hypothetical protein